MNDVFLTYEDYVKNIIEDFAISSMTQELETTLLSKVMIKQIQSALSQYENIEVEIYTVDDQEFMLIIYFGEGKPTLKPEFLPKTNVIQVDFKSKKRKTPTV